MIKFLYISGILLLLSIMFTATNQNTDSMHEFIQLSNAYLAADSVNHVDSNTDEVKHLMDQNDAEFCLEIYDPRAKKKNILVWKIDSLGRIADMFNLDPERVELFYSVDTILKSKDDVVYLVNRSKYGIDGVVKDQFSLLRNEELGENNGPVTYQGQLFISFTKYYKMD